MFRLLKVLLSLVVFAACFVGGFAVFRFHFGHDGGSAGLLGGSGGAESAGRTQSREDSSTSGTGALASIVQDYKQAEELAKAGGAAAGTAGTSGTVAAATGTAKPLKAVRTPDPTKKVIREWPGGRNLVALTFDDGPNPQYTPKLLELLKNKGVHGTFFLLGDCAAKNPGMVQEIVAGGNEVGSHTWSHKQLPSLPVPKINEELDKTAQAIKDASGVDVTLLRPPYGMSNKKVEQICDEKGLKIIDWSVDTNDWRKEHTSQMMVADIMKNTRDGAIILMHDRHDKTIETTEQVVDQLRAKGFQFVTVSELLGLKDAAPAQQVAAAAPAPTAMPLPAAPTVSQAGLPAPAQHAAAATPDAAPAQTAATRPAATAPPAVAGATPMPAVPPGKLTVAPGQHK